VKRALRSPAARRRHIAANGPSIGRLAAWMISIQPASRASTSTAFISTGKDVSKLRRFGAACQSSWVREKRSRSPGPDASG